MGHCGTQAPSLRAVFQLSRPTFGDRSCPYCESTSPEDILFVEHVSVYLGYNLDAYIELNDEEVFILLQS